MERVITTSICVLMLAGCPPKPSTDDTGPADSEPPEQVDPTTTDDDEDGFSEQDGDCDDGDASIHPGADDPVCDGVDSDCDGTGATPVSALGEQEYAGLQGALDAAAEGDTIRICPGRHTVAAIADNTTPLTITAWSGMAEDTVLVPTGDGSTILTATGPGGLTLEDLTFDGGDGIEGGALHLAGADLTGRRLVFTGNVALYGGAVYIEQPGAVDTTVDFEDCRFEDNQASNSGGAIRMDTEATGGVAHHTLRLNGTTLTGNSATAEGGGLALDGDDLELVIQASDFVDNVVTTRGFGGGFTLNGTTARLEIADSTFAGNVVEGSEGGGATVSAANVEASIRSSTFSTGPTAQTGTTSTLYLWLREGSVLVEDCGFASESAGVSAGLVLTRATTTAPGPVTLRVADSSFQGTTADALSMLGITGSADETEVEIERCDFEGADLGTTIYTGAALGIVASAGTLQATVRDCRFEQNHGTDGVATMTVADTSEGTLELLVEGCTFSDNSSEREGGAMGVTLERGAMTIRDSLFERNTTENTGGAIDVLGAMGRLMLEDVDFLDNTAAERGGAVYAFGDTDGALALDIQGGSFLRNSAGDGGALYTRHARVQITDVDLGNASDDNEPDDIDSCDAEFGAGSSFVFDEDAGLYCE